MVVRKSISNLEKLKIICMNHLLRILHLERSLKAMAPQLVHIQYLLEDCSSGSTYVGIFTLGKRRRDDETSIEVIKDSIRQNISSFNLIKTSKTFIVGQLYGKLDAFINPDFSGTSFKIDVSRNLGLPRYILNQGVFKITEYKVLISSVLDMDSIN